MRTASKPGDKKAVFHVTDVLAKRCRDDDSYVNKGCDFVMYRNPVACSSATAS